jgi:phage shock protein E
MKKIIIASSLFVGAAIIGGFMFMRLPTSEPADNQSEPQSNQQTIVESVNSNLDNGGALLVDVRTPEEFSEQRATRAINIPLSDIQNAQTSALQKDAAIYVYCRSGNRSAEAKQLLESQGYRSVVDLGGLQDIVAAGFELIP